LKTRNSSTKTFKFYAEPEIYLQKSAISLQKPVISLQKPAIALQTPAISLQKHESLPQKQLIFTFYAFSYPQNRYQY
jgi:hypothetical protein